MGKEQLQEQMYGSLLGLAPEGRLNASQTTEPFGCLFGRDSAITILEGLKANALERYPKLIPIFRQTLVELIEHQGKEVNIQTGERPGMIIHEFRTANFEHLTAGDHPWFLYPDRTIRNYDSIDSTALTLIAIHQFWQTTRDEDFLNLALPAVVSALSWSLESADQDDDCLVEYSIDPKRTSGGLEVKSWTDSRESLTRPDGSLPKYPIAPVEVQAYYWLAFKMWADFYKEQKPDLSARLAKKAEAMKRQFNQKFIFRENGLYYAAQALDGDKNQIRTVTANPLLCLWASHKNGAVESIFDSSLIPSIVERGFQPDLFDEEAGIRTMSTLSPTFNPRRNSYHNGSFWLFLNGLISEGLRDFGFPDEARKLEIPTIRAINYFGSPVELFVNNGNGLELYRNSAGQESCRVHAWSAAAVLRIASQ